MPPLTRRRTLMLGSGALAASALAGCGLSRPDYGRPPLTGNLIDAHCHLFNGTDLPITTFLTRLALPAHDDKTCDLAPRALRSGPIENPTVTETLIRLLVDLLLSGTLTAREERDRLRAGIDTTAASERDRVRRLTRAGLAAFLDQPPPLDDSPRARGEAELRQALLAEAAKAAPDRDLRALSGTEVADLLLASRGTAGATLRWVGLFFRSRQSLAEELVTASRSWGRRPLLLVPLVVDYAHWLGETTQDGSSFADQVAVYGALTRRSPVPIHGMLPFDPLRSVFWTEGRHRRFPTPEFDPLALAEQALTEHGFLGLKVYPPMGFRATDNLAADRAYPRDVIAALGLPRDSLGARLDAAMERAFAFCLRHDAPMLAHANNSLAAGPGYGRRAEPRFWIQALRRHPGLRLSLAHGGGFCWAQSDAAPGSDPDRLGWEWAIGQYVRDNPQSHLYMDISYFAEIFATGAEQDHVARQLARWIRDCDPEARHILFGTDWIMLERVPDFPEYGTAVAAFLKDRCGLSEAQVERVMWQNALRFLGLDRGRTRERLLRFHAGRPQPDWARMTLT